MQLVRSTVVKASPVLVELLILSAFCLFSIFVVGPAIAASF